MTVSDFVNFGFDPIVGDYFGNTDDSQLHLVPMDDLADIELGSFDDLVNDCGSEVNVEVQEGESEEEDEDIHKVQEHYMKLLASDYKRAKRAKQDRDDRALIRKNFEVLSALSHRVQMDHSIDIVDNDDDLCRPSDSFRCRDSNLRTLRKATKTLQELMKMSRQLKKEKREMKAKLKSQQLKANYARKARTHIKQTNSTKKCIIQGSSFSKYSNTTRNPPFFAPAMYSPYAPQVGHVENAHPFYRNIPVRIDHSNGQKVIPPVVYSNVHMESKPDFQSTNFNPSSPHDTRIIDRYSKPCRVISM